MKQIFYLTYYDSLLKYDGCRMLINKYQNVFAVWNSEDDAGYDNWMVFNYRENKEIIDTFMSTTGKYSLLDVFNIVTFVKTKLICSNYSIMVFKQYDDINVVYPGRDSYFYGRYNK